MNAGATFDKLKIIYNPVNGVEIAFGKNKKGNDHIIDKYKEKTEGVCYWFHLSSKSSAHAIVWFQTDDVKKEQRINSFKFVKTMLTANVEDQDVLFCRLEDVKKTKSLGEVIFVNETYMSGSNWTDKITYGNLKHKQQ